MMKGMQNTSAFDIPCSVFDILLACCGITNLQQGTPNDEGKT